MLSHSHPAYLSQLRIAQENSKSGADKKILLLTAVSMTVPGMQLVLGGHHRFSLATGYILTSAHRSFQHEHPGTSKCQSRTQLQHFFHHFGRRFPHRMRHGEFGSPLVGASQEKIYPESQTEVSVTDKLMYQYNAFIIFARPLR